MICHFEAIQGQIHTINSLFSNPKSIFTLMSEKIKSKSLMGRILDGALDAVKRPIVENRVIRAFDSAIDDIEEQICEAESKQFSLREQLGQLAQNNGDMSSVMTQLVELRGQISDLKEAKVALIEEMTQLCSVEIEDASAE
jgi:seryl-tRNA synthetase